MRRYRSCRVARPVAIIFHNGQPQARRRPGHHRVARSRKNIDDNEHVKVAGQDVQQA